jgi:hypothetical protein
MARSWRREVTPSFLRKKDVIISFISFRAIKRK